jgi:hypothetical protein
VLVQKNVDLAKILEAKNRKNANFFGLLEIFGTYANRCEMCCA